MHFKVIFLNVAVLLLLGTASMSISWAQTSATIGSVKEMPDPSFTTSLVPYQNKMLLTGRIGTECTYKPFVALLDANHKEVWSTIHSDDQVYEQLPIVEKVYLFSDEIYAVVREENSFLEIWRIEPSRGHILWRKRISNAHAHLKLLALNEHEIAYFFPVLGHERLHLISKNSGETTKTYSYADDYFRVHDGNNGSLYFTNDSFISKVNKSKLDEVVWKKDVNRDRGEIFEMHPLDNGEILLLAEVWNRGHFIKIDADGNILFDILARGNLPEFGARGRKGKLKGDFFYSYNNLIYSGEYDDNNYFQVNKLNVKTGQIVFNNVISLEMLPSDLEFWNFRRRALVNELDIDKDDNLWIIGADNGTGHHAVSVAEFVIAKIDGQTGEKLFDTTITHFPDKKDNTSSGIGIIATDSIVHVAGNLLPTQEYERLEKTHVGWYNSIVTATVSLDKGMYKIKNSWFGKHKQPSYLNQVVKHKDFTLFVQKNNKSIELLKFDNYQKLLWKKEIDTYWGNIPVQAAINSRGEIGLLTVATYSFASFPFSDPLPQLVFYVFDAQGAALHEPLKIDAEGLNRLDLVYSYDSYEIRWDFNNMTFFNVLATPEHFLVVFPDKVYKIDQGGGRLKGCL